MQKPQVSRSHGGSNRGQAAAKGRFRDMFGERTLDRPDFFTLPTDNDMLWELAKIMTGVGEKPDLGAPIDELEPVDENPTIPSGYTYFGQFVDHDISFDPTSLKARRADLEAKDDFRTPALDLDSVYGDGPNVQPYLYVTKMVDGEERIYLRDGRKIEGKLGKTRTSHDLQRLPEIDGKQIAVIGDKRNDENKIVTQLHAAMIALHNRLTDDTTLLKKMGWKPGDDDNSRFNVAVMAARWHYQWVVLFDFVDRLCVPRTVHTVLNSGSTPRIKNYLDIDPDFAYIPMEFAVAAYRLGHSMVRPSYALNEFIGVDVFDEHRVPIFVPDPAAGPRESLNGFGSPIASQWGIDWSFFLDGLQKPTAGAKTLKIPQLSYRIDASLVNPLQNLPEFFGGKERFANLAYRNLLRGTQQRLPSGEAIAHALGQEPIPFDALWWAGSLPPGQVNAELKDIAEARQAFGNIFRSKIEGRTPLWYYILREAEIQGTTRNQNPHDEFGGQHLGSVGSTIVAETFVGLLWMDENSFIRSPIKFDPVIPRKETDFELADLIKYALG